MQGRLEWSPVSGSPHGTAPSAWARMVAGLWIALCTLLAACGGGGGGDPGAGGGGAGGGGGGLTPPVITVQPALASVAPGGTATFSVTATGNGLAYSWQRSTNGGVSYATIAGATAATLTIGPVDAAMDGHRFVVIVQNGAGIVTSNPALLTVMPVASAPAFTAQPADQTVAVPAPATFTVAASGTPAPTIAWQSSTDGGTTWSTIAGASGTSYTTPATSAGDDGKRFRAVATNASGNATSNAARLTVGASASGPAFVYTANAGSLLVTGYAVDRATGAVTPTPGSPYAGAQAAITSLVLHPNGRFLYAVEANRTWLFLVDPTDGRLIVGAGSPFATPSMLPGAAPFADPAGRLLVYNTGQLSGFAIDATTGALTPTGAVTLGLSTGQVEFSADSSLMFVNDGARNLRVLRTNPLTLLTDPATIVPLASGSRLHARNGFVVAQALGAGLTSYAVGPSGALTPVQTLTGGGATFVAHPNGRCLFQISAVNGNPPTQSVTVRPVVLDLTTGALSANADVRIAVPGSGARASYPLTMTPGGTFGYFTGIEGQLTGLVTPAGLDGAACSITAGTAFDASSIESNFVVDSSGAIFVGYLGGQASLRVARVDPVTRVPVQVTGSPFTTTGGMFRGQVVIR